MVRVWPALSETLEIVAVWEETETEPADEVTWPAPAEVCGAVQPAGTATETAPFVMPPVGAVKVIVSDWVVPASTGELLIDAVPEPSAALLTVTDGEAPIAVSVPPAVDFSFVVQLAAPVVVVATPFVYVIVSVWPALSDTLETVAVCD